MKRIHPPSARELESLCTELRPDDGLPPQEYHRRFLREPRGPNQARSRQYCKAVYQSLEAGLAGVCADPRLKSLTVQSVETLHGGAKLLVTVTAPESDPLVLAELEQTLHRASGLLRSIVAAEIQRKRTPQLRFQVLPEA
jgi:ribosome-binding factor A